jgi:hypothetical protein
VARRVKGHVLPLETPIEVHDLSRTGFSVISAEPFKRGDTLEFHLIGDDGTVVRVAARAVHSRQIESPRPLHLSGFMFVPGAMTGRVPQVLIDQLIESVTVSRLLIASR